MALNVNTRTSVLKLAGVVVRGGGEGGGASEAQVNQLIGTHNQSADAHKNIRDRVTSLEGVRGVTITRAAELLAFLVAQEQAETPAFAHFTVAMQEVYKGFNHNYVANEIAYFKAKSFEGIDLFTIAAGGGGVTPDQVNAAINNAFGAIRAWAKIPYGVDEQNNRIYPEAEMLADDAEHGLPIVAQRNGTMLWQKLAEGGLDDAVVTKLNATGLSVDDLSPFGDIRIIPIGIPGGDIPAQISVVFDERLTTKTISSAVMVLGGQRLTRHASTPISNIASSNRGFLRYSVSQAIRDALGNNITSTDTSQEGSITFTFSDTSTYVYDFAFPVNNPAFELPDVSNFLTQAQVDARVAAGNAAGALLIDNNRETGFNGLKVWSGTQAQYDAITNKDNSTLYFVDQ